MDKSSKLYNKALKKYNNGFIDKAFELCEKSISLNINNSAAINLKGLLYYIKGDINSCRGLWKMNFQLNKDRVSEKYIQDSSNDEKLLELYNTALILIKELKINEALILLKQCEKSHFNYINVNNYLALCYIKKGNYEKAIEYVNNVLKVDNKNKDALENKKSLQEYSDIKRVTNYKSIIAILIGITIIFSIVIFIILNRNNTTTVQDTQHPQYNADENKKEVFPYGEIKNHIDEKDFNKILEDLIKWNNKDIGINEKSLLAQGKDLIESEGAEYFYNNGYDLLTKGDYSTAKIYLERAYKYGSSGWYYPHAIYLLGTTYEKLGDIEKAIMYYTIYDNKFESGDYEETVLYKLSLLYKNIDISKAEVYAKKLVNKFPQSIYNNSKIKSIIGN